jgi:CRISPR-associated endonuclease Cas1/CRISPR-associated protein Cas4
MQQPDGNQTPSSLPEYIPARMLNEFAYCPRLAYLEWVQGEWADNLETTEGRYVHRRAGEPEGPKAEVHTRSLHLSSERLGLTAVVDVVEREGNRVRPVEYKRGKTPIVPEGAYEPERVQLCAQALLLRERGYECHEGLVYYAASRERVRIRFTPELEGRTRHLLAEMRETLRKERIPPPLDDSPKCPRCSLVSICLPEEVRFLTRAGSVRPLAVADPALYPFVVQEPGATIRVDHDRLVAEAKGKELASVGLERVSQVVLMGTVHVTTPALQECMARGVPVVFLSGSGWFYGLAKGLSHKNVELRARQFATAGDGGFALELARSLIAAKIANARVLLRRNGDPPQEVLDAMAHAARQAEGADNAESLLAVEGQGARLYFSAFATMLKDGKSLGERFDFERRTRRPPADPVNALLSFAYTLLTKDWAVTLESVGFDPMMGYYHKPRYGRPALALDLMEPFRPVIGDSVVISVLNNGEVGPGDFYEREGAVLLKPEARKRFVGAYERRLMQEIQHPLFGYAATYRRIFEIQARLLGRLLFGEIPSYPAFKIR